MRRDHLGGQHRWVGEVYEALITSCCGKCLLWSPCRGHWNSKAWIVDQSRLVPLSVDEALRRGVAIEGILAGGGLALISASSRSKGLELVNLRPRGRINSWSAMIEGRAQGKVAIVVVKVCLVNSSSRIVGGREICRQVCGRIHKSRVVDARKKTLVGPS